MLEIFENVGRQVGGRFTTEMWEELLKIMLGIVDSLLKGGRGNMDQASPLGMKLCPILLRVSSRGVERLVVDA